MNVRAVFNKWARPVWIILMLVVACASFLGIAYLLYLVHSYRVV